jgi:hypothetical protein
MKRENWRDVPGYEGVYQVSDLGRMYSVPRRDNLGRYWGGYMLKQALDGKGYPLVTLRRDGRAKVVNVHCVVTDAFLGPLPDGMLRRHLDGDPLNCRLSNLAFGTPTENSQDSVRHGTSPRGARNGRARLTAEMVAEARRRRAAGETVAALADEFGISASAMSKAIRGDTWTEIERGAA